jgi:serine/threonine-protein kinase RsbW
MAEKAFREVRLVLPMEPNREVEASEAASALATSVEMDPDRVDELRMAVLEACINAFEHSLANDGRVFVTLSLIGSKKPERIRVTVQDHGVGFSDEDVGDSMPRVGKTPQKRGWGLTIIHRLMDEVHIESNEAGTMVVMSKQIDAGSGVEETK